MSKTVSGEENLYFELQSKDATRPDVYEVIGVEESTTHAAKGDEKPRKPSIDPEHASSQPDAVRVGRPLYIMTAAAVVASFLTAAATLVLALIMTMSQNSRSPSMQGKMAIKSVLIVFGGSEDLLAIRSV